MVVRVIFLSLLLSVFAAQTPAAAATHYPKLFFSTSWLYDGAVCQGPDRQIPQAWSTEADARQAEFSKLWETEAPVLFGQLFRDFDLGFSRTELTATLSVCPYAWSYSNPLVIRVLPFLKNFVADNAGFPLFPDCGFSSMVFHELLHEWLVENFDFQKSALLQKYQAQHESDLVLAHLHLMAIQYTVYLELGRKDLLDFADWHYKGMKDPAYGRAWEIATKLETPPSFTSEIREQHSAK